MKLSFLLVKVLDQTTTSLLHLIQSSLQTNPERCDIFLALSNLVIRVLGMPDVVSDELLQLGLPSCFQIRIVDVLNLSHESVHILN